MSVTINLLGIPSIETKGGDPYRFRSLKSWALLALLLLAERPPTRIQIANLLFGSADDPLRALRWSLFELQRALGEEAQVEGNPITLSLPEGSTVDVEVLTHGPWDAAVALPGLGSELLEGMAFRDAAAFESWLLSKRSRFAAATEATLHEAALSSLSAGSHDDAVKYAVQLVSINPYDDNHQALVIRCFRMTGDERAARLHCDHCVDLFSNELGIEPGPAVQNAMRSPLFGTNNIDPEASVKAIIEAGHAAMVAGATASGVDSLRAAVSLADRSAIPRLRVESRLVLAEAVIHSLRGEDEEGTTALHIARDIVVDEDEDLAARVRIELGYIDFLRARYDQAETSLTSALDLCNPSSPLAAKAQGYLGAVHSDRGSYPEALSVLNEAVEVARGAGDGRTAAYAQAMLGRIYLLRGDLEAATEELEASIGLGSQHQWLAFLPWPLALLGETQLARGDLTESVATLNQAFAQACQLGDPCWEGAAARALALAADAQNETERAFQVMADARVRCNRLSDTYLWLNVHILDAQCRLGLKHGHHDTESWIATMHQEASRTGMRELVTRSLLHNVSAGDEESAVMARVLAADIDNLALKHLTAL
ncbi:MAG: tetratricopeptide repeat protein [Acidimicrobiia bacterium]|nr:tetratricopeptide repeat protein [Acidimicrobiia bacterium]